MAEESTLKWFIMWTIINIISLFLIGLVLKYLNVTFNLLHYILLGFGVTIIASLVRIFTDQKKFTLNMELVYWAIANTILLWVVNILLKSMGILSYILILLISSLILVGTTWIVGKIDINGLMN